ncbi:uncharacterized protein LOC110870283 [Helianthus annuus]|uniref:uncharacterized protein LOC110870283 n=1 Tax=Helianthus annuus TaxID=4232 RepID=UPI000B8F076D|nr:uncharacterized protein LOC110870283 [Helianthus annuus]
MNFLSINICDLGSDFKSAWIKGLKLEHKISFLAMQEIQIGEFSSDAASKLWGNNCFEIDFVGATGRSGGLFINIINVYDPQRVSEKRFMGCFIGCGQLGERNDLIEYDMKGRSFTFLAPNSNKLSKIDRMLVCKNFFDKWPDACLRAIPRLHSDHSPVILVTSSGNFGVKPFKFFNSWLERDDLEEVVENAVNTFDNPDARPDVRDLSEEELWIKEECVNNIRERERWALLDLKQKSRCKWALDGDENSMFFHRLCNNRKRKNGIPGLMIGGSWVSKPKLVKKEILGFFRNHFTEFVGNRPGLVWHNTKRLSEVEATGISGCFTGKEIKNAVFECGSDKAPGPDGFNFKFLKHFWKYFEDDFRDIMASFYE